MSIKRCGNENEEEKEDEEEYKTDFRMAERGGAN
jgi:hypothetical protein